MPRGAQSIEIIAPMEGFRGDLPIHKLQPDMLAAGSFNVICDATNILRARFGFLRLSAPNTGPTKPLTGGVSWTGVNGQLFTIVADTQNWWQFKSMSSTPWTPLSNPFPVGPDDFTVFANIPVSGVDNLFGVNNNTASGLMQWVAGQTSVNTVSGVPFSSARGCFVLANRLVVYGTVENGVFNSNRVRWSQINNPTVFPLQAVADLADPGGSIQAGMRLGNLQAYFYMSGTEGTGTLETMVAQVGTDANAFSFQPFALGEGVVPPASVASIMAVEGIHYYLGLDRHIWMFDGIVPQNVGIPVQSDIIANADKANLKHSFVLYVPDTRTGRAFFPSLQSNGYPDRCETYSFDFNRWEAPAIYQAPFRCGFTGPLSSSTLEAAFLGGVNGGLYQLDASVLDDTQPITCNATWGVVNLSPLEAMQINFAEAFIQQTSASDVVVLTVSGLRSPLDALTSGAAFILQLNQANQFQQIINPDRLGPAARYYNWLQCSLQGTVSGSLICLGGYIHVNTQAKGVQNLRGLGPE